MKKFDPVIMHRKVVEELHELYVRKNTDYGNTFHDTFKEEGLAMSRIRLRDKMARFRTLSRSETDPKVNTESIRDTLVDLANYAIMTVMEIDLKEQDGGCGKTGREEGGE